MVRGSIVRDWLPVLVWAAVIFAFSSVPDLGTGLGGWDLLQRKMAHAAEYAILGALLLRATRNAGFAFALAVLYAASDELHQTFVEGRVGAIRDVAIDAIGAGPQVVAVDDQSDYPKSVPKTALSGFTPNVEAIAAYKPDLVVIAYDPKGLSQALGRLGITVLHQDGARSFKGAYQQIRQLGMVTGREAAATRLVTSMKRRIARLVADAKKARPGLTVYHELDPTLFSVTSKTFIGQVYSALGLRNIADAADSAGFGYPQLSAEYVVSADPDVIVLADTVCCGQKASTVAARPGWDHVSAIRTGSVVRIDDSIASRWGPRLVSFFRAVSSALTRLRQ
jgi:iron complex transport system substrate-binding protein